MCVCVRPLTHDGDVVLDLEQGFLAALGQHDEGVAVVGVVQRDAVHTEETITGTQRALSGNTHTHTQTHTCTHKTVMNFNDYRR